MSSSNYAPETTVLPPDRVRAAVRILVRLRRVMERADIGLTLPQYQLLALVRSGGERSARLADKLAVRKPTLTAAADALVAAGLLEREAESGDRRVVRLTITAAGSAAADRAEDELVGVMEPLFAESGEPIALFDLLDAVDAALDRRIAARRAACVPTPNEAVPTHDEAGAR